MASTLDERGLVPREDDDDESFYPAEEATEDFPLLDVYDEQPASVSQARPDALATISAGERVYRNEQDKVGLPRVSRDGTIFLHDNDNRAEGLREALARTGNKSLTIAFPFNERRWFWQERFARYSASRLEVYGDATELREIVLHGEGQPAEHVVYLAGTPEYDRLRRTCKVSCSIYFALAEWQGPPWSPRVIFPDGLGLYRLRTTSRHSRRNLDGAIQSASRFTGGQIAGLPFELRLTYREVPDQTGAKRNIPVWSLLFKPPVAIALSNRTWPTLRDAALAEGRLLQAQPALSAPQQEDYRVAEAEGDVLTEPSDADLAMMLAGDSPADAEHWRRVWFTVTDHTVFAQDVARHKFFERYTEGRTNSLAGFLKGASNADAEAMIRAATEELNLASGVGAPTNVERPDERLQAERARRYEEIFGEGSQAPVEAPGAPANAAKHTPPEQVEHEPTPLDDVLDKPQPPAPESDDEDFMPPEDADQRAAVKQYIDEVHRLIASDKSTNSREPATKVRQREVGNAIMLAVQGDVDEAKKLLGILTGGTRSSARLTVAQAAVILGLTQGDRWQMIVQNVIQYG